METFYLLDDGKLAGSSRPGLRWVNDQGIEDPEWLAEDLASIHLLNVRAIVSLTEAPLDEASLSAAGFGYLHVPIADMQAPTLDQLMVVTAFIAAQQAQGHAVLVHCLAGQGRTGTVLAAWLISQGFQRSAAVERIRRVCPAAIETEGQISALITFSEYLESLGASGNREEAGPC